MRLKTLVFLDLLFLILYGALQRVQAQDFIRYLQPGGGLTPEAQRLLRQSPEFNALTPEEVERGRIELERQREEREHEALAEKKQEEEEQKAIQDISNQEKELRYIANKYKQKAIRDLALSIEKHDDPERVELPLLDVFDQYQEDVIRDMVNRFELASVSARDPAKKLRDIFSANKREAVEKITDIATEAWRAETEIATDTLGKIFQDFIDRVIKEVLDDFSLKWAVKDTPDLHKAKFPYARPAEALKLFGSELFSGVPESFSPPTNMPVTDDYIVGPGDEIKVLMWGRIDAEYSVVVNRDGTMQFPQLGAISVAGLTYKDMRQLLKKKAESITGVHISITMGRLRSITVFVIGEVKKPGAYTISAFDTVINAVLISGGPTDLGSLRNVQLKRHDKIIKAIDFYDFLLHGDTVNDSRLQPGDVIFVPRSNTLVAISGNVKRPAIFELRGDLTLGTLIDLAGGLAPSAYKQRLQIERSVQNEKQAILDVTYNGDGTARGFILQDGDVVTVFPIAPEETDAVYVYGNVLRPGSYAYRPGMRVSDVIRDETELRSDTDFTYALIKRYVEPDMHTELVPFNLAEAILVRNEKSNVELKPYDEIYVFNKWLFTYKHYARIKGEIRNPGTYPLKEKMRIRDLIIAAGGLSREAYLGKCHLFRTDFQTKNVAMMTFNLEEALEDDVAENLLVQDEDEVVIHSVREYKPREFVRIYGMVNNPGQYPLAVGMTIKDLIVAGGNLRREASKEEAELVRFNVVDGDLMETEVVAFNVSKALAGALQENHDLREYDRVFIKKIPDWLEEIRVTVEGEVRYPGEYYVKDGEKLSSVIERAGGFTQDAYLRGAFFTRERARQVQHQRLADLILKMEQDLAAGEATEVTGLLSKEEVEAHQVAMEAKKSLLQKLRQAKVEGRMVVQLDQLERFKDSEYDVRVEDQDRLVIPKTPQFVNVLGEVYNATSFLYEKGKKVDYYLRRAGGPTVNAEKDETYIIRADGSVQSKAQSGKLFTWDPDNNRWTYGGFKSATLYPGDTLLVPRKLVKIHWVKEFRDITQIIFQIAIAAGVVAAI
jgi:polysaccharide export outer membrane protein